MEFTDRTIVLRLGGFKEADLWVRLLSPERGVFSAFAFGGSKSRKRFSGCLDLFNEVRFYVKSGARPEYLALQEGELLRGPERLRRDWRRLGVAVNCSLFLESFCPGMEGADRSFALFSDLLNTLEHCGEVPEMLPIFFRARLAFEHGYALSPDSCAICGKPWAQTDGAVLPVNESGLVCRRCAATGSQRFTMGPESLEALRQILELPVSGWGGMSASLKGQRECARAVDGFLQYSTGLYWHRGRFMSK